MKKLIVLTALFVIASFALAQKKKAKVPAVPYTETIVNKYTDSLQLLKNHYDSVWTYQGDDVLKNPYYFRLFFLPTLYNSAVNQVMENDWVGTYNRTFSKYSLGDTRDKELVRDSAINRMFANFYVLNPEAVYLTEQELNSKEGLRQDIIVSKPLKHEVVLSEKIKPAEPEEVAEPVKVISHRPNFWNYTARFSLQFMQNYQSSNWFQGKLNNNSMLGTAYFEANYNYNDKVKISNSLNARLGFQTERSDTVHSYHANTDELRMVNKFELRAIKNWYYSALLTSWTQMTPHYYTNSEYVYSDFMSPFECTLGLGMNFSKSKSKGNFSANISPLTFDFKYVDREDLESRYTRANHRFRETYGSSITLNWNWTIIKDLSWNSRMYYFTNYTKVQWEWENTFNFKFNKYLSTKFYVYPRFDDTQKDSQGRHRVQLKQFLSLGFDYSF